MKDTKEFMAAEAVKMNGAAVGIPTRNLKFKHPEEVPRYFAYNGSVVGTSLKAVFSAIFPPGERFFVESVRHFRDQAKDPVLKAMRRAIDECDRRGAALVIGNEATDAFSAGANLMLVVMAASQNNWTMLEKAVDDFQQANMLLRYSPVPVVVAPFGLTLGGGAEVTLHGDAVRAHAELYIGLVEVGVGLVPGGGGCKELLCRALAGQPDDADPFVMVKQVFQTIGLAKVATSAEEARTAGFLRETDGVTLNRDQVIFDAKQTALGLLRAGYRPPRPRLVRLPGPSGYANIRSSLQMMLEAHQILPHDLVVGSALARVLTGGNTAPTVKLSEQQLLDLEREAFLKLCGEEKTRDRMMYMLQNNKPLRN